MRKLPDTVGLVCIAMAAVVLAACVNPVDDAPAATATFTPRPAPSATPVRVARALPVALVLPTATRRSWPTRPTVRPPVPTPSFKPTPTLAGPSAIVIRQVPTAEKVVALTFDAGADRGYAPEILSILKSDGIKATFGATGRWAESNPDLLRAIVADGHELMNHTYDHRSFTGFSARPALLDRQSRITELATTEQIDREITGVSPRPLFRPPYGDQDPSVLRDVAAAGYQYSILWTVDSGGWKGYSTQQIVDHCLQGARPGVIYVFHVDSHSHDVDALPAIIAGLRARGYSFATIGTLLHLPPRH